MSDSPQVDNLQKAAQSQSDRSDKMCGYGSMMRHSMSFNNLFLFSVVDCCLLTAVVPVCDSDLFGWSEPLLGGPASALTASTVSLVVKFQ